MIKHWGFPKFKNLELELEKFSDWSFWFGLSISLSRRMLFIGLGLMLFKFELRWNWKGDHRGCDVMLEFLTGHFIDVNYYDSRHEEE